MRAENIIYIRADGSIDPSTAPIQRVGELYSLINDIPEMIWVERDNIVIDGNGHSLTGYNGSMSGGILLLGRTNVTVRNTNISGYASGMRLVSSFNNSIVGNCISNNGDGIELVSSSFNVVSENNITSNVNLGVQVDQSSSYNEITDNNITESGKDELWLASSFNNNVRRNNITTSNYESDGIKLSSSFNNSISGNNITASNDFGVELVSSSNNSIVSNNFQNSEVGIFLHYSDTNLIKNNSFGEHWGGSPYAVFLENSCTNSILENRLINASHFIGLYSSFANVIEKNNASGVVDGAVFISSSNNNFNKNLMRSGSTGGIGVDIVDDVNESTHNTFCQNTIEEFGFGVVVSSNGSVFYANNFIFNEIQFEIENSISVWDVGYPSGGNYWSNYAGLDLYSGPFQNETGSDGIGDVPYFMNDNNRDNYPIMSPKQPLQGDINGDSTVDIFDCVIVALAFSSTPSDPNWSPSADINDDGLIDIFDIVVVALHFGETG